MSVPSRDEIKTKLFVVGAPFKVLGNGLPGQVESRRETCSATSLRTRLTGIRAWLFPELAHKSR